MPNTPGYLLTRNLTIKCNKDLIMVWDVSFQSNFYFVGEYNENYTLDIRKTGGPGQTLLLD